MRNLRFFHKVIAHVWINFDSLNYVSYKLARKAEPAINWCQCILLKDTGEKHEMRPHSEKNNLDLIKNNVDLINEKQLTRELINLGASEVSRLLSIVLKQRLPIPNWTQTDRSRTQREDIESRKPLGTGFTTRGAVRLIVPRVNNHRAKQLMRSFYAPHYKLLGKLIRYNVAFI